MKFPRVFGTGDGVGGGGGLMLIHRREKKKTKTPHTCVAGSLMCCEKLICMSAKRSVLGSKTVFKFRGPEQEGCLNCMKPCNVCRLFHYDLPRSTSLIHSAGY